MDGTTSMTTEEDDAEVDGHGFNAQAAWILKPRAVPWIPRHR